MNEIAVDFPSIKRTEGAGERLAMVVCGVHRSGTSALTRVLSLFGYDLPATLLGASERSNPAGHWESVPINRLNDEVLKSAGMDWRSIESVDSSWYGTSRHLEMHQRALEVLSMEYENSSIFVLKDPRICLLIPFWIGVLKDFGATAKFAFVSRDAGEVAASLQKRNGIDPSYSELLWLRYVLESERETRGLPRTFVTYDQLLFNWSEAIGAISDELSIPLPRNSSSVKREISNFISPSLRHHKPSDSGARDLPWCSFVFDTMKRWAEEREDERGRAALDQIHAQFGVILSQVGQTLASALDHSLHASKLVLAQQKADGQLELAEQRLAVLTEQNAAVLRDQATAQKRLGGFEKEIETAKAQLDVAERLLKVSGVRDTDSTDALSTRLKGMVRALKDKQVAADIEDTKRAAKLAGVQEEVARLNRELKGVAAKAAKVEPLRDRLSITLRDGERLTRQIERLGSEIEVRKSRETELEQDLALVRAEAEAARQRTTELERTVAREISRVHSLTASLAARDAEFNAAFSQAQEAAREQRGANAEYAAAMEQAHGAHVAALAAAILLHERIAADKADQLATSEVQRASLQRMLEQIEAARDSRNGLLRRFGGAIKKFAISSIGKKAAPAEAPDDDAGPAVVEFSPSAIIREDHLFDGEWYLQTYPDIAEAGLEPALHYLETGAAEGRDPGPMFSTSGYLERNPDVEGCALLHYALHGRAEGRESLTVAARALQVRIAAVAGDPLFDAEWYAACHSTLIPVESLPAEDFVEVGDAEGRDPGPEFSSAGYCELNPDVAASGMAPFEHYLRFGRSQARPIRTVAEHISHTEFALLTSHPIFDGDWYLQSYSDVREAGLDPASHYLAHGGAELRDPGPSFDAVDYIRRYEDVELSGMNPALHYIRFGAAEGRKIAPALDSGEQKHRLAIARHPLFDTAWYIANNAEAGPTAMAAARHYIRVGATKLRDPGPNFRTRWYLKHNPDLAECGMAAFVFHAMLGEREGRLPHPPEPTLADIVLPSAALFAEEALAAKTGDCEIRVSRCGTFMAEPPLVSQLAQDPASARAIALMARLYRASDEDFQPTEEALMGGLFNDDGRMPYIADAWFTHDATLRLRLEAPADGQSIAVHLYQMEGAKLVCCGFGSAETAMCIADADLLNPFLPVLVIAQGETSVVGAAVIPFPSLLRGGAHYGETLAEDAPDQLTAAHALSVRLLSRWLSDDEIPFLAEVVVDLSGATGAERIFSTFVRTWLNVVFGVVARDDADGSKSVAVLDSLPDPRANAKRGRARLAGSAALRLPSDCLPTISILALTRDATGDGDGMISFILADPVDNQPCALFRQPAGERPSAPFVEPSKVPVLLSREDGASVSTAPAVPVAICFRRADVSAGPLFFPYATDVAPQAPAGKRRAIRIILPTAALSSQMLFALAAQTVAERLEIMLLADGPDVAEEMRSLAEDLFPTRVRNAGGGGREALAEGLEDEDLFLELDGSVVLHDSRTLEALATLASQNAVASAGCLMIETLRNGLEARPVLAGRWALDESGPAGIDNAGLMLAAFPRATFFTAGNSAALSMIPVAVWRMMAGLQEASMERVDGFAQRVSPAGYHHLTTTMVSAICTSSARESGAIGMAGENVPSARFLAA